MIVKKTYKFRLRPNRKSEPLMSQAAGACRWIFNHGLSERKRTWEEKQCSLSLYDQNKALTELKKKEETEWLSDVHSQILQQALGDLDLAMKAFFERVKRKEKAGYPHFRCRGQHDSFRYPQGFKVEATKVYLPKIGWIRFRKSREIEGTIKQVTAIREGGHWYVCFSTELILPDPVSSHAPSVIGIDLGLEHFAVIETEEGIEEVGNPRFLRKELAQLKFLSRQLSRKQKGSFNRNRAKARLQRAHIRIRKKRQDYLHKLSSKLVKSHDKIVVESLQVKELLSKAPCALARSISDAGWRQFLQYLHYKCAHSGKEFLEAGRWFPSTKRCFSCGRLNEMALSERQYSCDCGFSVPRDHNSAMNLRAVGTTGIKACGAAL